MPNKRNFSLNCHECGIDFKGLRPADKFCSIQCRWKNRGKQPSRIEWVRQNKSKWSSWQFNQKRDYMLRYTYGITQEQYEKILSDQGGGCAICGKTPVEEGKNLAVDHDHKTREIFGVLCQTCNRVLVGHIRIPEAFQRAAEYLKQGTGLFVPVKTKRKKRRRK